MAGDEDSHFIKRCEALATIAAERGEAPVGSIVVLDGEIIGNGVEAGKSRQDITFHAEIEAIREAVKTYGKDLSGATLYTTHEPCIMCSYVIRHHRIGRVVIQKAVPHIGGSSSLYPVLTAQDIPIWSPPPVVEFLPG